MQKYQGATIPIIVAIVNSDIQFKCDTPGLLMARANRPKIQILAHDKLFSY